MDFKTVPQIWLRALLFLAPLAMTVVRRSPTLLLAATAIVTLFQNRKTVPQQWHAARYDRALLAGLAILVVWGAISLLWSPLPTRGLKQLAFDFAFPLGCGLWLLTIPAASPSRHSTLFFLLGVTIAAALIALQLHFQFRLEGLLGPTAQLVEAWRFNMVVVTYSLFIPALFLTLTRAPLAAAVALIAIIVASALSQSASAKMALVAGALSYAVALLMPRKLSLSLFGLALFGLLVTQPWQGQITEQTLQATIRTERLFRSAQERIVIWKASGQVAMNALPWGTGMGSSDAIAESAFAKTLPPELAIGLRQTHAHNAFLNVVMELGLPGWIGLLLFFSGVLRTLARLPDTLYAPSMALTTQVITVDLISHGAWQAWWFTAIMLGILALRQYQPPSALKS
jgi:hypothetical protein